MSRLLNLLRRTVEVSCCVVVLTAGSSARASDLPQPVLQWLAAQTQVSSWTADLTQTRKLKSLTQPLISNGRVWFAVPNKIRWELGSPARTIAVRGVGDLVVVYPLLKRAERFSLNGSGPWKEVIALMEGGFFRDAAEFDRQFKVLSVTTTNAICTLQLQPKSSGARRMMPLFTLAFGVSDHGLVGTELQFADGSTLRNEFANAIRNPQLEESVFVPPVDPSYTVVEPMKR